MRFSSECSLPLFERVSNCLSCPLDWSYSSGFVTYDMIKDQLPAPSTDVLIVLCGPPAMIQIACLPNLDKLGHKKENVFAY